MMYSFVLFFTLYIKCNTAVLICLSRIDNEEAKQSN